MSQHFGIPSGASKVTSGVQPEAMSIRKTDPGKLFSAAVALLFWVLITGGQNYMDRAQTGPGPRASSVGKKVLVVSIDGLDVRYLANRDKYGLKIPTLRRLLQTGLSSSGVIGIYPTLTYPSHTTLVTGAYPIVHRIFTNDQPGPPDENGQVQALWFASNIKAETLWEDAHRAGLTVGMVSWPVGTGAADYNVPEIWKPGGNLEDNKRVTEENAVPKGLISEIQRADPALYSKLSRDEGDDARTRSAVYIIREKKPDLMLVHIWDFDHFQHETGPFNSQAFAMLEKEDAYLQRMIDAYRDAGLLDSLEIFIVSDHGFFPVSKLVKPGVLLVQNGLITLGTKTGRDGKGRTVVTDWKAYPYPSAGSCAIILKDPNDSVSLKKVQSIFKPLEGKPDSGILKVFNRSEIRKLGADPEDAVMLEGAEEYSFSASLMEPFIAPNPQKGNHGYLPTRYMTSFIASGKGITRRGSLGKVKMIDIGPTIAAALGLKLRDAQGVALLLR
jgi:predicted AlkP superfamily phosphohydrolase/phosphomutase